MPYVKMIVTLYSVCVSGRRWHARTDQHRGRAVWLELPALYAAAAAVNNKRRRVHEAPPAGLRRPTAGPAHHQQSQGQL